MIDIDVHVKWLGWIAEKITRRADEVGIDKVCLLGWDVLDGAMYYEFRRFSTEEILEAYNEYPDRIIPFCVIYPRREDAVEKTQRWASAGCRGFGEHKVRLRIDNPDSIKIYQLCGELNLPVLFHMDAPLPDVPTWYNVDIDGLEKVLRKCSNTIFVGHGPGWWREISKNAESDPFIYPKGPIKPGGKLEHLLRSYPNMYADISATSNSGT